MFKPSFIRSAALAALTTALTALAHAEPVEQVDPGQLTARGAFYALVTEERCLGRPLRPQAMEKPFQEHLVQTIAASTGSSIENIHAGMIQGVMQATFAYPKGKKPSANECKEAHKMVKAINKL